MNFINQAFFAIVITSMTGTIGLGFLRICKGLFLRWNPNLVYLFLRLVCLLYLLPVAYVAMQITVRDGYMQTDAIWQMNFSIAGLLETVFLLGGIIWSFLTIQKLIDCTKKNISWQKVYRMSIPMEEEEVWEEFYRICQKLGIRRSIRIYKNCAIKSPMITGICKSSILLPDRAYTTEQLTVIFFHELTHYQHHDVLYKFGSVCVSMLQHLNFCADRLLTRLNEWSEFCCDTAALEAMRDEITPKRYFEIIMELMYDVPETRNESYIFSMLCENQQSLERRIDYMKKYTKAGKTTRLAAFAMSFLFVMSSVTTAYAAGNRITELHDEVYQNAETVTMEDESVVKIITDEEFYIPAEEDEECELVFANPEAEYIMPILDANEMVSFTWNITPNTRHVSSKIHLKAGQTISASCSVTPNGQTYWLGIMDPHNNVRCVEGTGSMSHEFTVTEKGNYRVMVQNKGTKDIKAGGSYYFY